MTSIPGIDNLPPTPSIQGLADMDTGITGWTVPTEMATAAARNIRVCRIGFLPDTGIGSLHLKDEKVCGGRHLFRHVVEPEDALDHKHNSLVAGVAQSSQGWMHR